MDLFAAANHVSLGSFATNEVNKIRLGTDTDYFNSGVLLIDLARCRQEVDPKQVFAYVEKHQAELFLPDQDVLNALYGARILPLEDLIWNYDPRNYSEYKLHSRGKADTRWVIQNTAVLHFCGRDKPWKKATAAASVRCTCTICTWQTGCCPPERALPGRTLSVAYGDSSPEGESPWQRG